MSTTHAAELAPPSRPRARARAHAWLRVHAATALVVLAFAMGAGARFAGSSWGSPYLLHIDEGAFNLRAASRMEYAWLREGWPRPSIIPYGALPSYVLLGAKNALLGSARAHDAAARARDAAEYENLAYSFDPNDTRTYYWPSVLQIARAISALLYMLTMLLAWRVAVRLYGETAGVLTALALAGCEGLVQHAHYFTPEAFMTAGATAMLHACVRIAERNRARDYAYLALAMAASTSAKVTMGALCVLVPLATFFHFRARARGASVLVALKKTLDSGRLWLACVAAIALWFWLNPAAFRNMAWYFDVHTPTSPAEQIHMYRVGGELPGWALFYTDKPHTYFLTRTLRDACGAPLEVLALAGSIASFVVERGARRLPALFAALLLAMVALAQVQTIRYLVPALPMLMIGAGWLVARAWRSRGRASRVLAALGALAIAHGMFLGLARANAFRDQDNRVAALRWLEARATPDDRIFVEDNPVYTPPLGNEWGVGEEPGAPKLRYRRSGEAWDAPGIVDEALRSRFIVLHGWNFRLIDVPRVQRTQPNMVAFYRRVLAEGAPPGFRLAAKFDDRPHLLGYWADESDSEMLSFAFDHIPVFIYERLPVSPAP